MGRIPRDRPEYKDPRAGEEGVPLDGWSGLDVLFRIRVNWYGTDQGRVDFFKFHVGTRRAGSCHQVP
jgi:hypothetical protein